MTLDSVVKFEGVLENFALRHEPSSVRPIVLSLSFIRGSKDRPLSATLMAAVGGKGQKKCQNGFPTNAVQDQVKERITNSDGNRNPGGMCMYCQQIKDLTMVE